MAKTCVGISLAPPHNPPVNGGRLGEVNGGKEGEGAYAQILDDLAEHLERMNFLFWYRNATAEDMKVAWQNNAERLDELMEKYKTDIQGD